MKLAGCQQMGKKHSITVAPGDGIGPEIMDATLRILEKGGANLDIEKVSIGEKLYLSGHPTGIETSTWDSLRRTKVFLKAPITTPQGGGFRSLNVTIRTTLGLFANVRPCISYYPVVRTKHPNMDVVIIRENEEDLYTGIEYRQTPDMVQALKLISRSGSERIIRYAFEYARRNGRKKVTTFTKDNILKMSDGLFHKIFDEIGEEYPDIQKEHWIIDIGAAKLADTPEAFDVIVLINLYGDILSDVAAQITGSVGLGGSANIGEMGAMFEAIHGSAPRLAGKNLANPSGLLLGSILMLLHLHEPEVAMRIHNAWLKTLEDGIHTYDIFKEGISKERVGTREFADAVIERLGQRPMELKAVSYEKKTDGAWEHHGSKVLSTKRELVGVDIYVYSHDSVEQLIKKLQELSTPSLKLTMVSNRGARIWPDGMAETFCVDHWRCRFEGSHQISIQSIASLLHRCGDFGLDAIKTENLYTFDGEPGFSK